MEAAVQQMQNRRLAPEWERIELLCYYLICSRQGKKMDAAEMERLRQLQQQVVQLRQSGGFGGLSGMTLSDLELDILVCVVAPEMEARIGWMFQELQPGITSTYPTPALIQEILALAADDLVYLYQALESGSTLRKQRLIKAGTTNHYIPLQPAPGLALQLMGQPSQTLPPPGSTAVAVRAVWDDLVLPASRIAMLREFLLWIQKREIVTGAWGGAHVGGPIALLSGPSGTGKSFAASVIAHELGWPLYRVDLGQLVSKYIGETEKNLNALFDAADDQAMVLQFDEADSLFGKRGEVKDAHDRYANMGVSHLLARIESHRGPCILTTNLRKHLDSAFARRFQMVIDFPRPDANDRARLWQRLLPPDAPKKREVDTLFLGRAVVLSGGQIRNAALHAAYLAAGDGSSITLAHIALAVWRELAKDGREVARRDLGALANHLPEALI